MAGARIRIIYTLVAAGLALSPAAPAAAQLHAVTESNDPSFRIGYASSAAYDPVHDCYFVVSGGASVTGRFINPGGANIGAISFDARAGFSAVAYSPDIRDGAGGFGGFLAIWSLSGLPGLFGQIVSFPRGPIGPPVPIRPTFPAAFEFKGGIAYSPVDHVFLVALGEYPFGINNGRLPTRIIRLNQDAQPLDDILLSSDSECPNLEFSLGCNQVDVAWNPISTEFGVLYGEGPQRTLARISGSGTVSGRIALGISGGWGALAVNTTTGSFLAVGGSGSLISSNAVTDGAEVSPGGAILARGLVTSNLETDRSMGAVMRLSYSRASGTFLLAGKGVDSRPRLLELNQHGVALGDTFVGDQHPTVIASYEFAPQWLAVTWAGTRYIIATSSQFGGSEAHLPDCITPDPFVAFGGGRCVNGGWLFPTVPVSPPPAPVPGGCVTPDPFVAFGGGRCVDGGWLFPIVSAPPPPAPVPGGCITPDPFVAFGGGRCVDGGWLFPTVSAPPPPAPVPGGCLTPDPFVAFGGGRCVDGGWLFPTAPVPPPPAPVPGGCLTPDPFVALGGGRCVNGGWYPPGS